MMRTYYAMLLARGEDDSVGKMKQFATYFTHGIRGGAQSARRRSIRRKKRTRSLDLVDGFFETHCDEESPRLVLA